MRAQECYSLTQRLLECDPYALEAMPIHLTAALELRKKNDLFLQAHRRARLVERHPSALLGVGSTRHGPCNNETLQDILDRSRLN